MRGELRPYLTLLQLLHRLGLSSFTTSVSVNAELVVLRFFFCFSSVCLSSCNSLELSLKVEMRGSWEWQEVMVSSGGGGRGQLWSLFMVEVGLAWEVTSRGDKPSHSSWERLY